MGSSKLLARAAPAAVALLALLAGSPARGGVPSDPLRQLERWIEDYRRGDGELSADRENSLAVLLADLRMARIADPARAHEVALGLLDLAGVQPRRAARGDDRERADSATARVREHGRRALRKMLAEDPALAAWLAGGVIVHRRSQPEERRVAALELLAGRHDPSTLVAVLDSALDKDPRVRAAALEALVGWQDDSVHRFFVAQIRDTPPGAPDSAWPQARRHFGSLVLPEEAAGTAALREHVAASLLATDWRETVRALHLAQALPDPQVVPHLIEALAVWLGRAEHGQGSRRIEGELLAELKRRSRRNIGPHPERWATWWKSRSRGRVQDEPDGPSPRTRSGFFGLRPMTDRVAFVIDRSGSMAQGFGGSGRSRYEEALAQMEAFLRELGPQTRFRVILFDSGVQVWSSSLKPATDANLVAARSWAASRGIGGSTALRGGIEEVFRLRRGGEPDLARIEEDTLIVLCDGETNEGPQWVPALMERANAQACIAIHGVQIGRGGDGTLELLAEGSGGEFVVVGG